MTPRQWREWHKWGVLRWRTKNYHYLVWRDAWRQARVIELQEQINRRGTDPRNWPAKRGHGLFPFQTNPISRDSPEGVLMLYALQRKIAIERQEHHMRRISCKQDLS